MTYKQAYNADKHNYDIHVKTQKMSEIRFFLRYIVKTVP